MNAQHTPGPWAPAEVLIKYGLTKNDGAMIVMGNTSDDENSRPVADVNLMASVKRGQTYKAVDPERDANMWLICAAPDLLALARAVAAHFADTDAPLGEQALAAIARAEGR